MRKIAKPRPSVIYDDGIRHVDYVGRMPNEINAEIHRVVGCLNLALRNLRTMRRVYNPAVRAAIFVLENVNPKLESSQSKELARISFLMGEALQVLAKLKNGGDYLKTARFQLLYGQTPKKRDREAILSPKKSYTRDEEDKAVDPDA